MGRNRSDSRVRRDFSWCDLLARSCANTNVPDGAGDSVAETIDLSQAGTTRGGEASTVPPVALPRRVVAAHILLPYFSPGGKYVVSVTMDRTGDAQRAEGLGTANVNGIHADLTVTLDLRGLPEGTYYLGTTHEGDQASYYYPLTVR